MKFNLKKDVWGVVFATGIGVVTFLTYKIGKTEGSIEAYSETNNFFKGLLESIKEDEVK